MINTAVAHARSTTICGSRRTWSAIPQAIIVGIAKATPTMNTAKSQYCGTKMAHMPTTQQSVIIVPRSILTRSLWFIRVDDVASVGDVAASEGASGSMTTLDVPREEFASAPYRMRCLSQPALTHPCHC